METVSVTREFDAPAAVVREAIRDVERFLQAAGFDVSRDGDVLTLTRRVAVKRIELAVRLVDTDATLAYEQLDGIFEKMRTQYLVEAADEGSSVTVETAFEPATSGFGTFVNSALVRRLRRMELADLDALFAETASAD